MSLEFLKLNDGWNAEPNAPRPNAVARGDLVSLRFVVNSFIFDFDEDAVSELRFYGSSRYRLGRTNDEGWYRDQCRYSRVAPAWGESYEIIGADPISLLPNDWRLTGKPESKRHFLFYLKDQTFECFSEDWSIELPSRGGGKEKDPA